MAGSIFGGCKYVLCVAVIFLVIAVDCADCDMREIARINVIAYLRVREFPNFCDSKRGQKIDLQVERLWRLSASKVTDLLADRMEGR